MILYNVTADTELRISQTVVAYIVYYYNALFCHKLNTKQICIVLISQS